MFVQPHTTYSRSVIVFIIVSCGLCLAAFPQTGIAREVTVSPDGKGKYTTIQAALDHASERGETIRIAPGTYHEKLSIHAPNVRLIGMGKAPEDVVLTFDDSAKTYNSTSKSASVTVSADGFEAENLTIENSFEIGHPGNGGQAVALLLNSDRAVLDRVRFLGAQDTLYANSRSCHGEDAGPCLASRQYFNDCFVEGHVDFIFGDAKAVFNHCAIRALKHGAITVTAQSRNYANEDSGYVFLHCSLSADAGVGKLLLGRPWRAFSTVLFYDTEMLSKVDADGWSDWDGRLKTSTYREYGSRGPGVNGGHRIVVSPPLTEAQTSGLTPAALLAGKDHWDPESRVRELRRELAGK